MPTGSPLLDQYNQTGQMTPGLQRAIDIAKQKLGDQFQFPAASPAQAQPGGMARLRPPESTPVPQFQMPGMTPDSTPAVGRLMSSGGSAPTRGGHPFSSQPGMQQAVDNPPPLRPPSDSAAVPKLQMPGTQGSPSIQTQDRELARLTAPPLPSSDPLAHTKADTGRPGESQIHNRFLRGLATAGDIALSSVLPGAAVLTPGTQLHHQMLVNQRSGLVNLNNRMANDQANRGHLAAEVPELGARASEEQARADALRNPPEKQFSPKDDYISIPGGGLFNARTREWERPPVDKSSLYELSEDVGKALKVKPDENGRYFVPMQGADQLLKPAAEKPDTAAQDDQAYEKLIAKRTLGQKLTPDEDAQVKAYEKRKTLGAQVTNFYAGQREDRKEGLDAGKDLSKKLQNEFSTVRTQLDNIGQAREELNSNPVGQSLGAIKTLTALAGGKGSGVRITQAELNSLATNLGIKGSFENWLSSVSGQGRFGKDTLAQINAVLSGVERIAAEKESRLNDTLDSLGSAKTKADVDDIEKKYRHSLSGTHGAGSAAVPTITGQADYDRLPSGAAYIDAADGKQYRKK